MANTIPEPLAKIWTWIGNILPTELVPSRPRLNFLTVHYIYMIGMTIIISIMLYPAGILSYTDSLFFAAGTATQSGLNTVNINDLNTYQQVVMMLMCCVCTPVFINTFVVFVRLYWFEKRFAHLVKEIRSQRRTKTLSVTSRSKSQMKGAAAQPDSDRMERGVNGRPITVLHDTTVPNGMNGLGTGPQNAGSDDENEARLKDETQHEFAEKLRLERLADGVDPVPGSSQTSSNQDEDAQVSPDETPGKVTWAETAADAADTQGSDEPSNEDAPIKLNRGITFADELSDAQHDSSSPVLAKVPSHPDLSKHIAFLERQQQDAKKKGGALRIPGPRDFDKGAVPTELGDGDDALDRPLTRQSTSQAHMQRRRSSQISELNADDHPVRRGITIDLPDRPNRREGRDSDDEAETSSRFDRMRRSLSRRRNRSTGLGDRTRSFARTLSNLTARSKERDVHPSPYLSWEATTGRNSAFLGLSQEQREELGGIEYRALKTLAGILLFYYFGFHLLGLVVFTSWIEGGPQAYWSNIVRSDGQNPAWWGIFTPASMFNDLGFTLTPDSMMSFQYAILPLLLGSFFIIIGNTGFPCMLRFIIWILSKVVRHGTPFWEELRFLLDHPRRCFTLLFPSRATWWLFGILVILNGIDLIFFIILDLNDSTVTTLSPGYRVLNGWFQAASTRTAGFACVNIADLHPAIQVSYLIMMYISVFPIAISVRRTNVYEEKSLGIFGGEEEVNENGEASYVGQHLRRQLSFDLWYIFLGFFIIAIVEGSSISDNSGDKVAFTLFSVLFEIVSAYGTVGLSLGYPNTDPSFSAQFHVISKLVIIAMMIRGRHRGLPYALDRAILLPSEKLQQKEAEDADRRRPRFGSIFRGGLERGDGTFEATSFDEYGLPKQHIGLQQHIGLPPAPTEPLNPGDAVPPSRMLSRRMSNATTASTRQQRARNLGRFLAGGLGAGPTFSKQD